MNMRFFSLVIVIFFNIRTIYSQIPTFNFANGAGNSGYDVGFSVASDMYGNSYVTGYFNGIVDFDPSTATASLQAFGFSDAFIAKYDANGNYIWAIKISGTTSERGNDLVLDTAGNVYVTGSYSFVSDFDPSPSTATLSAVGNSDIFVAKYNKFGQYQWAFGVGSTGGEYGQSISLDKQDNIYVTGNFSLTADFDPSASTNNLTSAGGTDAFIAKYDSNGQYIWATRIGGTLAQRGETMALDTLGYLYLGGIFYGTSDFDPSASTATITAMSGNHDGFIAKYDCSNGQYQWAIPISGPDVDYPTSLGLDLASNIYVTGYFRDSTDFDPSPSIVQLVGSPSDDGFIAKYNGNGQLQWVNRIGETSAVIGQAISVTGNGDIVVVGGFAGSADFDLTASTYSLTSAGGDIFVAGYTPNGNFQWVFNPGPGGNDFPYDVYQDQSGSIFVTGLFNGVIDFDPSSSTTTISAVSGSNGDIFLAKYSQVVSTNLNEVNEFHHKIFPNPTSGVFIIQSDKISQITIFNQLGEKVLCESLKVKDSQIDISHFSSGIYFVEIINDKGSSRSKLIKQ